MNAETAHDAPPKVRRLLALVDRSPARVLRWAGQHYAHAQQSDDPAARAWAAYAYGWALLRTDRRDAARAPLAEARGLFAELGAHLPLLRARHALVLAEPTTAETIASLTTLQVLEDHYRAIGQMDEVIRARLDRMALLNQREQAQAALALASEIHPLLPLHGTPADHARLLRSQGIAYCTLSQFAESQQCLDQAASTFTQLRLPVEVARCHFEQGWLNNRREHRDVARQHLEQAWQTFKRFDLRWYQGLCEKDLGVMATWEGRFDWALAWTLQARAKFAELHRFDSATLCDLNLANIAFYSGLYTLAAQAYESIAQACVTHGFAQRQRRAQRNRALVLRAERQLDASLALLYELEAQARDVGDIQELAEIHQAQAEVLRDSERWLPAAKLFDHVAEQLVELGNTTGAAKCHLEAGWVYLMQQVADPVAAVRCFTAVGDALDDRPLHRWRLYYGQGRCALLQGEPDQALARFLDASAIISKLRERLASEHASSGLFAQAEQLHREALRLAADLDQPLTVLHLAEQHRALALRRQILLATFATPEGPHDYPEQHRDHIRALVSSRSAPTMATDTVLDEFTRLLLYARHSEVEIGDELEATLDLAQLRHQLDAAYPQGWVVLLTIPCGNELLLLTYDSVAVGLERVPLDAQVQEWLNQACLPQYRKRTYLAQPLAAATHAPARGPLDELGDWLITPALRRRLHANCRLLIVPGEQLHQLPWAALRINGSWLCEQAVIQLLPGLVLWPTLAARQVPGDAALLIGCSHFNERSKPLPNALLALDAMQQQWAGPVTRLENEHATRSALQELGRKGVLRTCGVIQFTSHAQLTGTRGHLAHIKLYDDDVFLDEIARLPLGGALVALFTCDGAASEVLPGDEVLGLSRGFLAAGARDVVASLWQMYDNTVTEIVQRFYRELRQGRDVPTALAEAQRGLIRQFQATSQPTYAPLVWASLCATGAGTSLVLPAGGTMPAVQNDVAG